MRATWRDAGAVLGIAVAGLALPDLDLALGLAHRSALTHSVLPALVATLHPDGRRIAAGLALGIGVHLSADSFPNAMTGYATVKLPLAGSLGRWGSYAWLMGHALAALMLGAYWTRAILPARAATATLSFAAAGGVLYLFVTDGGWGALAVFAAAGWGARGLRQRGRV